MKRVKKYWFLVVLFFSSLQLTNGLDWVFQGYIPSLFNIVSGNGAVFHQFSEEVEDRFILPFEAKFLVGKLGVFAFSANGIFSYYMENNSFGSINLSAGIGISRAREDKSPLQGLYFSLYPVYELPVIAAGKTPYVKWKSAMDLGIGFNFLSRTDFYISIYARTICFWVDDKTPLGAIPDFGITVGWHFQDRMYIDEFLGR